MIIIMEGFDDSGKTTMARYISQEYEIPIFRSSDQTDLLINKEEAFKHDWRMLLDLFFQVKVDVIFDRSFITQYVYSINLRKQSVKKEFSPNYMKRYNALFCHYCQKLAKINHYIFLCNREDYSNVNNEYNKKHRLYIKSSFISFHTEYDDVLNIEMINFENGFSKNKIKVKKILDEKI